MLVDQQVDGEYVRLHDHRQTAALHHVMATLGFCTLQTSPSARGRSGRGAAVSRAAAAHVPPPPPPPRAATGTLRGKLRPRRYRRPIFFRSGRPLMILACDGPRDSARHPPRPDSVHFAPSTGGVCAQSVCGVEVSNNSPRS